MRFTLLTTLVAFTAVACGGEKKSAASQAEAATPTPAAPSAAPASSEPAGAGGEGKMRGNGTCQAAFAPGKLTIKPGTIVRFINVSGGPHNVAFYPDSVPKGGVDVLKKGMPNPMGDLTGPFLTQPNEKYDVSFAGAAAGVYKGYCMHTSRSACISGSRCSSPLPAWRDATAPGHWSRGRLTFRGPAGKLVFARTKPVSLLEQLRAALLPEYYVEREIASGGMGVVYLARDVALACPVAVKILRPELATAAAAERFVREAQTAAKLRHPNIVIVHSAGERRGFYFYVMDYIEDPTLAQRLERGPLPPARVVKLGRDLLDALEHAHTRHVVHRDIKPSNVFIAKDRALLGDFGIAKAVDAASARDAPGLTGPRGVVGTLDYMPPEQAAGGEVTPRTDLYAVGMVLYEALTGRPWSILDRPDRADWSAVPRRIARVLRRAVQWAPEARWPDAASFRRALWRTRVWPYQI